MATANVQAPALRGEEIKTMLFKATDKLAAVLPKHLSAEKMIQVASLMVYRTPRLAECVPATVLSAVIRAGSLGLDLEPSMNEAFLIPRWHHKLKVYECNFQLGYQGCRKLALQSGKVSYIRTSLIYSDDDFEYYFDPELRFRHRPARRVARGVVTEVYGHAKLSTGDALIEVMSVDEVNAIMHRAKEAMKYKDGGYPTTPWDTDWSEMSRKTVLKRLCKSLPRSPDLDRALAFDDEIYDGSDPTVVSVSPGQRRQIGRPGRGLAALQHRAAASQADEPAFDSKEGVDKPLYTEADDEAAPPIPSDDDEA